MSFDRPPSGFRRSRSSQGWLKTIPNPQAMELKRLRAELEALKQLVQPKTEADGDDNTDL